MRGGSHTSPILLSQRPWPPWPESVRTSISRVQLKNPSCFTGPFFNLNFQYPSPVSKIFQRILASPHCPMQIRISSCILNCLSWVGTYLWRCRCDKIENPCLNCDPLARTGTTHAQSRNRNAETRIMIVHKGGCHCGAVRFEVDAPGEIEWCKSATARYVLNPGFFT